MINKRVLFTIIAALLINSTTINVSANSHFYSLNNILYYDKNADGCNIPDIAVDGTRGIGDDPIAQGGGLSAKLMEIKDANKFAEAINIWIRDNSPDNSPFRRIKIGELAIMGGKRAGINPILPIIIARMESSYGTAIPTTDSHNAYGRTATASQPHVSVGGIRWYKWDSFEQSLYDTSSNNDMYMYIKDVYSSEIEQGITQVMMKYAPPHENNTADYVNNLNTWAKEIYTLAGDSIDKSQLGEISDTSNINTNCGSDGGHSLDGMTIYYQADFEGVFPNCGTIAECGCGATSLAMILATLLNDTKITPVTITNEMSPKGYTVPQGTAWEAFTNIPHSHGLKSEDIGTDISKAREALLRGGMIVMSQDSGLFTKGGHIVVIRGLTKDGRFLVADPNKSNYAKGDKACRWDDGLCTSIPPLSGAQDINNDGSISYTENSSGFSSDDITASLKGMWVITK